ncbi:MAG: hypothetical protein A2W91_04820 [Bacteroidetes bacterium GWF2_38_335]|nr:MAG: hypothetical protein A2W91_04820 [Bacteroidetes bacterium GWF2_38_335]OFY80011.1 MAG: hypothetical protein A2281_12035 [Bacteroidetes bacterium RIFOXYA12_FULL_38_20]HBS85255.1 hypothetical protein [Bacteroidales bacterium]
MQQIQNVIINKLKTALPGNQTVVSALSQLLGISQDATYRRLRGDSAFSIDEIALICRHFRISFDECNNMNSESVSFTYKSLNSAEDLHTYLLGISREMKALAGTENPEIHYAAVDIPIFYHFGFENVSAFKIFYWLHSVMNTREFEMKQYDKTLIPKELMKTGQEIYDSYCEVKSVEIWSDSTMNSMIKQIEFYWESGMFNSKEDALDICNDFELQLKTILKMAETSSKKISQDQQNFILYFSDIEIGNNCIQSKIGNLVTTYLSHHTFNSLTAYNQKFNEETTRWMENLKKKSSLLSGVGHKQRFQFFNRAMRKINALKAVIVNE